MKKNKIWIDIVTAPDILFFAPIINKLKELNLPVVITGRKFSEVPQLSKKYNIDVKIIDNFYGKNKITKIFSLIFRCIQLFFFIYNKGIKLSFGYVSRPAAITSRLLKIEHITSYDYEEAEIKIINKFADFILLPKEITQQKIRKKKINIDKIIRYPGLKEEVYTWNFIPDEKDLLEIGIRKDKIFFIIRMSSIYANYSKNHQILDYSLIDYLLNYDIQLLVLPRYNEQRKYLISNYSNNNKIFLLNKHVNGQNLVYFADAVFSGGGSMIREAVCLGTPAYDIFNGKIGSVEQSLIDKKLVNKIKTEKDFYNIEIKKKMTKNIEINKPTATFNFFIEIIIQRFNNIN